MEVFKRTKRRCRICKEQVIRNGYLYKCKKSKGMHVFWHRSVLSENLGDEEVLKGILEEANIPAVKRKKASHFVYVIKLSGNPTNSLYVGMTGHHPYQRYLNHLRNYKASRHVFRRGQSLQYFEGPMTNTEAKDREVSLADELKSNFRVYGGH